MHRALGTRLAVSPAKSENEVKMQVRERESAKSLKMGC